MPPPSRLSKSRFMFGQQCELRLWNDFYHADLATPPTPSQQARFDAGNEVGSIARKRCLGVLVEADHRHPGEALAETADFLRDPAISTIHEAAFEHQGAFVRVDILTRRDETWDVIEVKSVLEAKDVHILDAAFQRWVVAGSGLRIGHTSVMVLNREYRYEGGELDVMRFFRLKDVSTEAQSLVFQIEADFARFQTMLQRGDAPNVQPGPQCLQPYECPYLAHCTRNWPRVPDPVEWIPRLGALKAMGLHAAGIHRMADLPTNGLNAKQLQVVTCHSDDRAWVDGGLKASLTAFETPMRFLDFETFSSPVPRLIGSRPSEAVPVQWSCHTLHEDGRLTHEEFLADELTDPREHFVTSLLEALGNAGSICVYSSYEKSVLTKLARDLSHREGDLRLILKRLVDLLTIVRNHVYLPGFQGSYSIKNVLPALVPGFGYKHLQVHDGQMAVEAFGRMLTDSDLGKRQTIRDALLAYCAQDTLAMVKLIDKM